LALYLDDRYRYCYVVGWLNSVNGGAFANAVTKVDVSNGGQVVSCWRGDPFQHPSEPVFLPKTDKPEVEEDEGVLVSVVTDVRAERPDFVIFLDARSMTELARASLDGLRLPMSSHGFLHQQNA
jgi:carotenoid cleavage dioxygenase-like enzyme